MTYVGKIRAKDINTVLDEIGAKELERWLDETSVPLSNEEIVNMSVYFNENNLCKTNEILDIIEVNKDNKKQTK